MIYIFIINNNKKLFSFNKKKIKRFFLLSLRIHFEISPNFCE